MHDFCLFGPSWGSSWSALWASLGPLGPSWRHLGPSWRLWWPRRSVLQAILGILDALESARDVSWRRQSLGKRGRCTRVDASRMRGGRRILQKPYQTAFGILARLNVPGGTVADLMVLPRHYHGGATRDVLPRTLLCENAKQCGARSDTRMPCEVC